MALSRSEQDCVVTRVAADDTWTISCSIPSLVRKLERIAKAVGTPVRRQGPESFFTLPVGCVAFRAPRKLTAEDRAARAARLQGKSRSKAPRAPG